MYTNRQEADFMELKGEVTRTMRSMKARESWISKETWRLADRQAALQRAQRASAQEVSQARQNFQRSLQGNRQQRVREVGEAIGEPLVSE